MWEGRTRTVFVASWHVLMVCLPLTFQAVCSTVAPMNDAELFAVTSRPDPGLFYRRDDPNDPRLGEVVRSDPRDLAEAEVVLLGCPQDEGVRRNRGRPGAAEAPTAIRACFYKLGVAGLSRLRLFDLGDTQIQGTLEETHALQRRIVARLIGDGKLLISLGGGNDLAYPDLAGLADVAGRVLGLNVDAHFDVRADWPANSGTPYRQLLDEGFLAPERHAQLGSQPFANSPIYANYLAGLGVPVVSLRAARAEGLEAACARLLQPTADAIFWGLDMDVVRAADAPGVSAPNPLGMTGEEFCKVAEIAGAHPRTRLIEITEVNPAFDLDQRTCRLAAVAIWSALAARWGLGIRD